MNDFQYIKTEIERKVSARLGKEATVSIEKINKQGGVSYAGLIFKTSASISPVINLDSIIDKVVDDYCHFLIDDTETKDVFSCLRNYEEAKKHLAIRCCNLPNNISYLEDKPYRAIADDIAAYLVIDTQTLIPGVTDGTSSSSVTYQLLKSWGVSFDEVYKVALNNGFKPYIGDLLEAQTSFFSNDFMQPLEGYNLLQHMSLDIPPMFCISNQKQVFGASILAYPEALKMLSDFFSMDLMVIPSSVHEILVLPFVEGHTSAKSTIVDEVSSMIQEVNATSVAEEDILSSTAYLLRNGVLLDIEDALTA